MTKECDYYSVSNVASLKGFSREMALEELEFRLY